MTPLTNQKIASDLSFSLSLFHHVHMYLVPDVHRLKNQSYKQTIAVRDCETITCTTRQRESFRGLPDQKLPHIIVFDQRAANALARLNRIGCCFTVPHSK